MKLTVKLSDNKRYIAISVCNDEGKEVILRRFPWPKSEGGRRLQSGNAYAYARPVADVLGVRPEVDSEINASVLGAGRD